MYFQTLDDKSECIGVYVDGVLYFDNHPDNLSKTWKYSGSLREKDVEYVGLWAAGADMSECCPQQYKQEFEACSKKLSAYIKSFKIAKVNLRDHCIFDLIPQDFLQRFCEVKNKITEHVYENYEKPKNYDHLKSVSMLLHKIKYQKLNLSTSDCRHLLNSSRERNKIQSLINNYNYIDYNLFGTATGRLTTRNTSFPILTLKKEMRQIVKPQNDLFVCLDYNGAEVRTLLSLSGEEQPKEDIHAWNAKYLFEQEVSREECKVRFFAWLYDPLSDDIQSDHYDRSKILDKWYKDGYITTPYKRKIQVDQRRALNYLLQSTTSDRVLEKAVLVDKYLVSNKCKSHISHIVHDEVVLDFDNSEREHVHAVKEIFEDGFMTNLSIGKDYYNLTKVQI